MKVVITGLTAASFTAALWPGLGHADGSRPSDHLHLPAALTAAGTSGNANVVQVNSTYHHATYEAPSPNAMKPAGESSLFE